MAFVDFPVDSLDSSRCIVFRSILDISVKARSGHEERATDPWRRTVDNAVCLGARDLRRKLRLVSAERRMGKVHAPGWISLFTGKESLVKSACLLDTLILEGTTAKSVPVLLFSSIK